MAFGGYGLMSGASTLARTVTRSATTPITATGFLKNRRHASLSGDASWVVGARSTVEAGRWSWLVIVLSSPSGR
jgi:hypothetical protein